MKMKVEESARHRPEGGYRWYIVIAAGVMMMCGASSTIMFSVLFRNVFEDEDTLSQQSNSVFSMFMMTHLIIGLFVNPFMKRNGSRNITLFGALLFVSGNLIANFASGYLMLLLSYGIISGIGFGIAGFTVCTKIISHFQHLEAVAFAMAHVINVTGCMLYPVIIKYFIETSGRKTAQLISTGFGMHMIAAALLLDNDTGTFQSHTDAKYAVVADFDETLKHRFPVHDNKEESLLNKLKTRFHKLFNADNIRIVFSFSYINISLGINTTLCSESIYFNLLPIFLLEDRCFSLHQTTTVMIVTTSGDLCGRALIAIFGKLLHTRNRICFLISMILTSFAICGTILDVSFTSITIFAFFLGLFRGIMYVTTVCVYVDAYGSKPFPVIYGVSCILHAICFCTLGPLIGIFRDYTQSYTFTFIIIMAIMVIWWILWIVEILVCFLYSKKCDVTEKCFLSEKKGIVRVCRCLQEEPDRQGEKKQ